MKYLKKFQNVSDYDTFKVSDEFVRPNVSYIVKPLGVYYNPIIESINVGDVAYWDGSKIKTVPLTDYNESMGQAIGVVVIPNNFLPDRKARMVSLNQTAAPARWDTSGNYVDTSLPNYQEVPITNDYGSSTNGSYSYGYMPSDLFVYGDGDDCIIDSSAKYYYNDNVNYIPSPYRETKSGLILNQDFIKTLQNGNALSDFNGKANTDVLVGLGSAYEAANYAKSYSDGVSDAEWYLPACGELSVMFARLKTINDSISTLGGTTVATEIGNVQWSSSEYDAQHAYVVWPDNCKVHYDCYKNLYSNVLSFAMID